MKKLFKSLKPMAKSKFTIVGFSNEKTLVKSFAKELNVTPLLVKEEHYGAGEINLTLPQKTQSTIILITNITEKSDALFRTLLLGDYLRRRGVKKLILLAPWIAYGRQDSDKHPAGLFIADELQRSFDNIITLDAHSPEFIKGFKGKLTNVLPHIDNQFIKKDKIDLVLAPDKGAKKRVQKIAQKLKLPFLVLSKSRTHEKVSIQKPKHLLVQKKNILIIDDIADSGSTLLAVGKLLQSAASIHVLVTHAMNSKKLQKKFKKLHVHFQSSFDHASGNIDPQTIKELILLSLP